MVYFVGAGTGAIDMITIRGMRLIEECDVLIYAGSLVNPELLHYAKKDPDIYDSALMTLPEIIEIIERAEGVGKNTVRLHTGDPGLYSAMAEQMRELDKRGIEYEVCPGVTACFSAAASLKLEYTLPGVSQTLIITRLEGRTEVPPMEKIEDLSRHQASMAVYLSAGMMGELADRLISGGYRPDTPAAIVYKASWPDEKKIVCSLEQLEQKALENNIKKTAVVLVGDAIGKNNFSDSKLYSPDFFTEYRMGKNE